MRILGETHSFHLPSNLESQHFALSDVILLLMLGITFMHFMVLPSCFT